MIFFILLLQLKVLNLIFYAVLVLIGITTDTPPPSDEFWKEHEGVSIRISLVKKIKGVSVVITSDTNFSYIYQNALDAAEQKQRNLEILFARFLCNLYCTTKCIFLKEKKSTQKMFLLFRISIWFV